MRPFILIAALPAILAAGPAAAYVGPGLGLGALGVVAGFFAAIVLACYALVGAPIRRFLRRRRGGAASRGGPDGT